MLLCPVSGLQDSCALETGPSVTLGYIKTLKDPMTPDCLHQKSDRKWKEDQAHPFENHPNPRHQKKASTEKAVYACPRRYKSFPAWWHCRPIAEKGTSHTSSLLPPFLSEKKKTTQRQSPATVAAPFSSFQERASDSLIA